MSKNPPSALRLLLPAALALALAGCGGDASSNPSTTTAATTSTTTGGAGGAGAGGGGAGGSGTTGSCFDYASWSGTAPTTTFQAEVLPIFRRSCGLSTSCHGSETGKKGQPFLGPPQSAGDAGAPEVKAIFDQIVDVASTEEPDMKIVAPGDPAKSFLVHKLDGPTCKALACVASGTCGTQMPQGTALDPAERDVVRRWIAQGAKDD